MLLQKNATLLLRGEKQNIQITRVYPLNTTPNNVHSQSLIRQPNFRCHYNPSLLKIKLFVVCRLLLGISDSLKNMFAC